MGSDREERSEPDRTCAEMVAEADASRIRTPAHYLSREIGGEIYVLTTATLIEAGETS
jgi:hypothetical protein